MGTIGEILVSIRLDAKAFVQGVAEARKGGLALEQALTNTNSIGRRMGATMANASRDTFMFGITMKFFGMQVAKTMQKVMRDVTTTFTRIMESSGFTGSAIQQLGVHFEFLKFVIGSAINRALVPLMPLLIRFINFLAGVIQKHPKATLFILGGALAFGKMLSILGDLVLVTPQMTRLFVFLGTLKVWGVLATGAKTMAAFAIKMLAFAASSFIALLPLILIGGAIALGVVLIGKMSKAMGGWGELGKSVIRGMLRLVVLLADAFISVARVIANVVIGVFDMLFDFIIKGLNFVITAVNKLLKSEFAQKVGKILGVDEVVQISLVAERDIPKIGGDFGDLIEKYLEFEQNSALAPKVTQDEFANNLATGQTPGGDIINIQNVNVSEVDDLDKLLEEIKANSKNSTF